MVQELNFPFPRPITSFHQLELTSRCSLRCQYCIHPKMPRPKEDMTREVFERALQHVHYHTNVTLDQSELNLCGVGESFLHPDFVEFVKRAREVVGGSVFLNVTTNGLHLTEELAKAIAPYMSSHYGLRPGLYVSLHRPEKAKKAVDLARKYGLLAGVSSDPSLASIDWAGQVPDWDVTANPDRACPWLREGRAFVMSDGDVATCCMPATKSGIIGTVWDEPGTLKSKPYDLCASCDQKIGVKGYVQYPSGARRLPVAQED